MSGATLPMLRPSRCLGYRAQQVLAFVRTTIEREGLAPSYGMICSSVGIATYGEVSRIMDSLERRGLLRRVGSGRVRRIRLVANR
jgi:SOS-response transcriptional repressor LexA